jgi:hypothetical protein
MSALVVINRGLAPARHQRACLPLPLARGALAEIGSPAVIGERLYCAQFRSFTNIGLF